MARATRPSRLFSSVRQFILRTGLTILRSYYTYKPMKSFAFIAFVMGFIGMLPLLRFIAFYMMGQGGGHVQSLVIGSMLMIASFVTFMFASVRPASAAATAAALLGAMGTATVFGATPHWLPMSANSLRPQFTSACVSVTT